MGRAPGDKRGTRGCVMQFLIVDWVSLATLPYDSSSSCAGNRSNGQESQTGLIASSLLDRLVWRLDSTALLSNSISTLQYPSVAAAAAKFAFRLWSRLGPEDSS